MRKYKQIFAILLLFAMVLSLCACKASNTDATNIPTSTNTEPTTELNDETTESTTPPETTEPPTPSDTDNGVGGKGDEENDNTSATRPSDSKDKDKDNGDDTNNKNEDNNSTTPPTTPPSEPTTPPSGNEGNGGNNNNGNNGNNGNENNENGNNGNEGNGENNNTNPPEEEKPPVVTDPPENTEPEDTTPPVENISVTNAQLAQIEATFLTLVNMDRKNVDVQELKKNSYLDSCAQTRSIEIVNKWSHTRPNGQPFSSIIDISQYPYTVIGENLAMTSHLGDGKYSANDRWTGSDAQVQAAAAWIYTCFKTSSAHYANMIDGRYDETGIGISYILDEATGIPYFYVSHVFGSTN